MSAAVHTPHIYLQEVQRENFTFLLPFYLYVPCGGFVQGDLVLESVLLTILKTFAMQ
jgi:hypothetical protein